MDVKEDIRARLPIEQLVAQYCQLQKKGRNYVCLCPFHNDKKPSLLVSPDKGIAYCFACQSGGDIFSFFQRIEGVDFPTAVRMLADKTGVELPKDRDRSSFKVEKDAKERMRECLEAAQAFYRKQLVATPVAMDYVRRRGVDDTLLESFGIGYAPDSFSSTYEHLLKEGFSRTEIAGAGLGVQKELSEERMYDRFRNRIMFPIGDAQGKIIGFGGRAMGESDAKYVNSPDGPLYHKSTVLYGLHQAREAIRQHRSVLLVEGYFDVVAAHKAGVKNVVAVSGTALTEDHVRLLKRYVDTVILCLDQDAAGQQAANRAFQLLSKAHAKVHSVSIPAKDPDELVQQDAALFKDIVTSRSVGFIDALLERYRQLPDRLQPQTKLKIADGIFPLLSALPTAVELRTYLEQLSDVLQSRMSEVESDFRSWRSGALTVAKKAESSPEISSTPFSKFQLCIGLAAMYPRTRILLNELIPGEEPGWETLRSQLSVCAEDTLLETFAAGLSIDPVIREQFGVLSLYCEENFGLWSDTVAAREMKKLCAASNREFMVRKQQEIIVELKEARRVGRADEEVRLLTKYQQVMKLSKMSS